MAGATVTFPKPPRIKTDLLIPEGGIAIFLLDTPKPLAIRALDEFVLGREIEGSQEGNRGPNSLRRRFPAEFRAGMP